MLPQSTQPPAINESSFAALFEESLPRQDMRAGEVITPEVISVDQNVVIDETKSVAQAVKEAEKAAGAPIKVTGYVRFALGEGVEKKSGDFAAEVAAAVGGTR